MGLHILSSTERHQTPTKREIRLEISPRIVGPLFEEKAARTLPFIPSLLDPLLEPHARHRQDPSGYDDLERRGSRWNRESATGHVFDEVEACRVVAAFGLDVEAEAFPVAVGRRHRTTFRHEVIYSEEKGCCGGSINQEPYSERCAALAG